MVLDGPMNRQGFRAYVEQVLVPTLRPGTDSGDLERLIRSIMNIGSGDHEHPLALA
jgi:hypothetical protein